MSTQKSEKNGQEPLDEAAVAEYLLSHPEFFHRHSEVLEELSIPHDAGSAVSLVEYQLRVLREENRRFRRRLDDLLAIARDNDRLANHLHRFTLELIDADSLDDVLASLHGCLRDDLRADLVGLRIIGEVPPGSSARSIARNDPTLDEFEAVFQKARPVCGRLPRSQMELLFGDAAANVSSAALVPIIDTAPLGILGIGSQQSDRYRADHGTVFLRHLGALLARSLRPHIR